MTDTLLSSLPIPNIIEHLDYESILSRMKEELVTRDPTFTALIESDPAIKILEICAWRELLLRQRINEAARANLLAYALGSDLDHLAAFYGVERQEKEADKAFRQRVQAKIVGWSTSGTSAHYRYHALSSDVRVKDARVASLIPGEVTISLLSTEGDGTPSEALLDKVRQALLREDVRMLTDTVKVVGCGIVTLDIEAHITLEPSAPATVLDQAKTRLHPKSRGDAGAWTEHDPLMDRSATF